MWEGQGGGVRPLGRGHPAASIMCIIDHVTAEPANLQSPHKCNLEFSTRVADGTERRSEPPSTSGAGGGARGGLSGVPRAVRFVYQAQNAPHSHTSRLCEPCSRSSMQEDFRADSDSRSTDTQCSRPGLFNCVRRGIVKALCASSSLGRGRSHGLGPRDAPLEHILRGQRREVIALREKVFGQPSGAHLDAREWSPSFVH